jgi:hypothetical protein
MSSTSSQTLTSAALQRSNELGDVPLSSTINTTPTSFAPLHRTAELEDLHAHMNDDNEKETPPSTNKKILTKCVTVIGDGSDKQI